MPSNLRTIISKIRGFGFHLHQYNVLSLGSPRLIKVPLFFRFVKFNPFNIGMFKICPILPQKEHLASPPFFSTWLVEMLLIFVEVKVDGSLEWCKARILLKVLNKNMKLIMRRPSPKWLLFLFRTPWYHINPKVASLSSSHKKKSFLPWWSSRVCLYAAPSFVWLSSRHDIGMSLVEVSIWRLKQAPWSWFDRF